MSNSNRVFGRAILVIDGETYPSITGTATLNPGGYTREAVMGDNGFLGHKETPVPAEAQFDIAIRSDADIIKINNIRSGELQFQTDAGSNYLVRKCFSAEPVSIESGSGKGTVRIIGAPAEEA